MGINMGAIDNAARGLFESGLGKAGKALGYIQAGLTGQMVKIQSTKAGSIATQQIRNVQDCAQATYRNGIEGMQKFIENNSAIQAVSNKANQISSAVTNNSHVQIGGTKMINSLASRDRYAMVMRADGRSAETAEQFADIAYKFGHGFDMNGNVLEKGPEAAAMSLKNRLDWRYRKLDGTAITRDATLGLGAIGATGTAGYGAVSYFGDDD